MEILENVQNKNELGYQDEFGQETMMEAEAKGEYVRESTVTSVLTPAFGPTSHTHTFAQLVIRSV